MEGLAESGPREVSLAYMNSTMVGTYPLLTSLNTITSKRHHTTRQDFNIHILEWYRPAQLINTRKQPLPNGFGTEESFQPEEGSYLRTTTSTGRQIAYMFISKLYMYTYMHTCTQVTYTHNVLKHTHKLCMYIYIHMHMIYIYIHLHVLKHIHLSTLFF